MNASFEPFHVVNTYGMFGSVGRVRYEVILEGTADNQIDDHTAWKEYEFKCKPGNVNRRPCVIAPFHNRIDWQIWFAAMQSMDYNPWLKHLVYQLLRGKKSALSLIAGNPFEAAPPKFIRGKLFEYRFSRGEGGERVERPDNASPFEPTSDAAWEQGAWWERREVREYFGPISLKDKGT